MVLETKGRMIRRVNQMRILPSKLLHNGTPSGTAGLTPRFGQEANRPPKEMVRRVAGVVGIINQKRACRKESDLPLGVAKSFTRITREQPTYVYVLFRNQL